MPEPSTDTVGRRVAFLDVDGTITDAAGRVAASTARAVREARSRGHLVFLSTGRALPEIIDEVSSIGFDGAVTAGGGYAVLGDEVVVRHEMPEDLIARMLHAFDEAGCEFYLQSLDGMFPSSNAHIVFGRFLMRQLGRDVADADLVNEPHLRGLVQTRPVPTSGIAKGVFLGESMDTFERVAALLDDRFHVITGTIPGLGGGSGEVTAAGVTKGDTVLELLSILGVPPERALAIGDGANDVEMFDVVGVGIAMRDAAPNVRARANETTAGVLDDGIWKAFVRHGLALPDPL